MWGKFVAEYRAAPIPKAWKEHTHDVLRGAYYATLDEASEPLKQHAKAAFKTCVDYSVKYQYADEYSRTCHHWLSRNYTSEFPRIDEFVPRPAWLGPATPPATPLAKSP